MSIRFKCDSCGVAMKIKDELAGKKGKCPQCKNTFVIPELEEEPAEDEIVEDEADEEWEDDDDDDDLLDMPMELTAAPVTTPPPPPATAPPAARDRKAASESRKAVKLSSKNKPKSDDGGFDPTDVLFGDDEPAPSGSAGAPPRGRVAAGLDDDADDDDDEAAEDNARSSTTMSDMFKDFVPAGGRKKDGPSVDSTSVAAQALARRAEEKRKKANAPPEPVEEEEGNDYVGALRDVWGQYKLFVIAFGVLFLGASYLGSSMMSGGADVPDLYEVEGIVTKGGVPVVGAEITFEPVAAQGERLGENQRGGSCFTGEGGLYYVMYNRDYEGLPVGRYKVDVRDNGSMLGKTSFLVIKDDDVELNLQF